MLKTIFARICTLCLVAGCTSPQTASRPQAGAAGQTAAVSSVDAATTTAGNDDQYETIYVPPPVGSHLGGGMMRVPKRSYAGNDEAALAGNIRRLNAAAGSADERPFVIDAVARTTGVNAQTLQAQQDRLRLRFGDLCAINAIAHGDDAKVRQIANERAKGQTWTDVARSNGVNIAYVAQIARNANELTVNAFTNSADRRKGGQRKLQEAGVRTRSLPGE